MNPLEIALARAEALRADLAAIKTKRGATVDLAISEKRDLSEAEKTAYDADGVRSDNLKAELVVVEARIADLEAEEVRAAAERESMKGTRNVGGAKVSDPEIYAQDKADTSYFRDQFLATKRGDSAAADRIRRQNAMDQEKRALTTVAGAGGEFAPPQWLIDQFVALARPGRAFVDLVGTAPLPSGVSSINLPKVASGVSTAVQNPQNTALSQTDLTTTSLSTGITSVGGLQQVSLQLLEQSGIPFDSIILGDLAASYAVSLDTGALTGAGTSGALRGLDHAAGINTVAYTSASPAVTSSTLANSFYSKLANAQANVNAVRYMPADTVLMHPRRWAWVSTALDSSNRPLIVPAAVAMNPIGSGNNTVPQGYVGDILGMNVFVDPNLPINLGASTNQDRVFVFKRDDIKIWESAPRVESFEATYANTATVLFRILGYAAMIPDRYGSAIQMIDGTGLVTPAF